MKNIFSKILNEIIAFIKNVKLPFLRGYSLFDLLNLYINGIIKGAFSYRASGIAFSFFMALFPFALFILNLIPYIPIDNFQQDFLNFVESSVPPNTFDAIKSIIDDILNNSYGGLLSSGGILSVFLMANGVNAILGSFESSYHINISRNFFRQYLVSLFLSLVLSILLLLTVSVIVFFEVWIQLIKIPDVVNDNISILQISRIVLVILMILIATSLLFKFGTKQKTSQSFINIGSVFTTGLIIVTSYFFGIYVVEFAKYNELYGSIGTLLVFMIYIWINCLILLLGFELSASIGKLKYNQS
jgi:membrane protein